jgi:hypothetical protein
LPPPIGSGTVAPMARTHLIAGGALVLAALVGLAVARRPRSNAPVRAAGHEEIVDTAAPPHGAPARPDPSARERVELLSTADASDGAERIILRATVGAAGFGSETTKAGVLRGPAAPTVDDEGWAVLDTVRGELRRFDRDGRALRTTPLPSKDVIDAIALPGGKTLLFERGDAGQRLTFVDASGKVTARLPIPAGVVSEDADVSRVFVRAGTVYVETNGGGPLHAIGTTDGEALPGAATTDGYPTHDGRALLSAGITNEDEGRAWINASDRASGTHLWTKELQFADEASAVGFLDDDGRGHGWVVVLLGSRPGAFVDAAICFDVASGRVIASHAVPVDEPAWQSFRDFAVTPSGSLAALRRTKDEARVLELPCAAR